MHITVIYDNNPYKEGLRTAWGFACLITGTEKTILFDTGGDSSILLDNMEKLAIAPDNVDTIVLSHAHGDHTGGLAGFLKKNPDVAIYTPKSFPKKAGAVREPLPAHEICKNVYSTGRLGKLIKEQSLIIRTELGLIIITGCAHPGIVKIVNRAENLLNDDILLVMGGFHLEWAMWGKTEKIISAFKQSNVRYVAPCHCSADKARALFEKHFGENYINIGAGRVIALADLH